MPGILRFYGITAILYLDMDFAILAATVIGLVLVAGVSVLIRLVWPAGNTLPVTPEWIEDLSIEKYQPMLRLLDGQDLQFLRSQPGFTPRMAARLRAQRCQIFRGYLRCLSSDFGRIVCAIKILMLQSRRDRPDLAGILVQSQINFASGLMGVYCSLVLYRLGICGVDVSSLVRTFDGLRLELRQLVPAELHLSA